MSQRKNTKCCVEFSKLPRHGSNGPTFSPWDPGWTFLWSIPEYIGQPGIPEAFPITIKQDLMPNLTNNIGPYCCVSVRMLKQCQYCVIIFDCGQSTRTPPKWPYGPNMIQYCIKLSMRIWCQGVWKNDPQVALRRHNKVTAHGSA